MISKVKRYLVILIKINAIKVNFSKKNQIFLTFFYVFVNNYCNYYATLTNYTSN